MIAKKTTAQRQNENKTMYANNKKISANDKRVKEYERKDFTVKTKHCPTIGMHFKKGFNKLNKHAPIVILNVSAVIRYYDLNSNFPTKLKWHFPQMLAVRS